MHGLASLQPDVTGVDAWQVSNVRTATGEFVSVVIGNKVDETGTATSQVELVITASGKSYMRSGDPNVELDLSADRAHAVGDDLRMIST